MNPLHLSSWSFLLFIIVVESPHCCKPFPRWRAELWEVHSYNTLTERRAFIRPLRQLMALSGTATMSIPTPYPVSSAQHAVYSYKQVCRPRLLTALTWLSKVFKNCSQLPNWHVFLFSVPFFGSHETWAEMNNNSKNTGWNNKECHQGCHSKGGPDLL